MLLYYLSLLSDPGDGPLMTEMYETYKVRLYQYAFTLLHNQYDAEDAVMAAWERVARNFTKPKQCFMESQSSFFSYIRIIVKNLSLDEIKKRKRVTEFPENWDAPAPDNTEGQGEHDMIVARIKTMPVKSRKVLELQLSGYSFKEIGKRLGCSEDAAQKRYSRAIEKLRKWTREV